MNIYYTYKKQKQNKMTVTKAFADTSICIYIFKGY